jgi:hypothetical protein
MLAVIFAHMAAASIVVAPTPESTSAPESSSPIPESFPTNADGPFRSDPHATTSSKKMDSAVVVGCVFMGGSVRRDLFKCGGQRHSVRACFRTARRKRRLKSNSPAITVE